MTKQPDCTSVQRHLEAFVEGCLAGPAAEPIRKHLSECAACRAHHERLRAEQDVLRAAVAAGEPPSALADAISGSLGVLAGRERLRGAGLGPLRHSGPRRILHGLAKVAAVLLLVAGTSALTLIVEHTVFLPPVLERVAADARQEHSAAQLRLAQALIESRDARPVPGQHYWAGTIPVVTPATFRGTPIRYVISAGDQSVW